MTVPARSTADAATHRRVKEFLYHQADLLDAMRWGDYVALFARTGMYWMPARPEQITWVGLPSIFAEDIHLMEIRVRRLGHPRAWSQQAEWSTNHLVSNVRVYVPAEPGDGSMLARSSFHMVELRGDHERQFTGTYLHRLQPRQDGFEILLQRVDLLSARAPFDYVIQAWV
jgi:3-phenylpropionate/cinnamic acid dioxygenase small subunit